MTSSFEVLNYEAGRIAKYYGVRPELIIVHALSLAAAMSRSVVRSCGGPPVLPLLIRTSQSAPEWLEREWQAVETQQDLVNRTSLFQHPAAVAALRRRRRIQMLLDPDGFFGSAAFDQQIRAHNIRPVFGRMILTRSVGRPAVQSGDRPLTHLAATLPRYRTVLRRVTANPNAESLIGWMNNRDFKNLVRSEGPEIIRDVGLIIGAPDPHVVEPLAVPPAPLIAWFYERFIRAAVACRNKWAFAPEGEALTLLDSHHERVEQMLATLPSDLREAQPDPHLAWQMAAVLAFLSDSSDQAKVDKEAVALAIKLAEWAVGEHLLSVRLAWPADHEGLFAGEDLQIFRQLTTSPQPARNLQRALKGVDKDRCLAAVQRAISAGLVVEQPTNRFALAARPGIELSDSLK